MKRTVSLLLLLIVFLSGCGFERKPDKVPSVVYSENDSTVSLDIYPESEYGVKGKFERVGYGTLNDGEKSIYIQLDNAVYAMQTGFISLGACESDEAVAAYRALRQDRPEYFWLPISYSVRKTGEMTEIKFADSAEDWLYQREERLAAEETVRTAIASFLKENSGLSEYERSLSAHDMLAEMLAYDSEAADRTSGKHSAWNIVGAFCDKKAVCEGYSRAMQVLCYAMNIDCAVITGTANEAHMWNLLNLGGHWYHTDVTADDGDSKTYHFFFNVTTECILKSRTLDPLPEAAGSDGRCNIFLPMCNSTEYNYLMRNSQYIADMSQTESTVVSLICDAVRSGKRSVEIGVSPKVGFVFGETDAARKFGIERCISAANAELSRSQRIKKYSYGGVEGALGFVISW